ncbi:MAG: phosphoribosylaminoimidazolesuccinocarboxamide synthase [Verrucomicrobia bacterium]|jgi:phosphoribosylaminoimidazole-succinocarboxamide synthase|nr:phosphoribosylaminoimidazolesuccinocarboxamide synthase [Verrucomicrobiota bacterium]MBV8533896.1 phosphoribosylaminoimidazolesuccinocarboxamide synthase [Verrucomicrobiota bacterium]
MSGIMSVELPGIPKLRSGKVREVFDLGDNLLIVATDRISAFDCILPDPVPEKGILLTQLSAFWFQMFHQVPSHFVTVNFAEYPENLQPYSEILSERSMLVKKADPLPVECVVRGYLAGSGWKEYQEFGSVCGIRLPPGLEHAAQLPKPMFTPATKEASGHDRNIPWEKCCELLGEERATIVRDLSLAIYSDGSVHAGERGIIIADTKFEFGLHNDNIILIDECLTPDSSRFWPADRYQTGVSPVSFDKQFVRDYLETLDWNKTPPAPHLPPEVIEKTTEKYREAFERLAH